MNASLQSQFASALLDPGVEPPDMTDADNRAHGHGHGRFGIHRNNVVSSLIDALSDNFPVVERLVGHDFFRAMASVFVRQYPPSSRVMMYYGGTFPVFLATFSPASSLPYLADVARLEAATTTSLHAPDCVALSIDDAVARLGSAVDAGALLAKCHPSFCAMRFEHAAVSIWHAHEMDKDLDGIDELEPQACWVVRNGLNVLVVPVSPAAIVFSEHLLMGRAFHEASREAEAVDKEFEPIEVIAQMLRHGALASIDSPAGGPL